MRTLSLFLVLFVLCASIFSLRSKTSMGQAPKKILLQDSKELEGFWLFVHFVDPKGDGVIREEHRVSSRSFLHFHEGKLLVYMEDPLLQGEKKYRSFQFNQEDQNLTLEEDKKENSSKPLTLKIHKWINHGIYKHMEMTTYGHSHPQFKIARFRHVTPLFAKKVLKYSFLYHENFENPHLLASFDQLQEYWEVRSEDHLKLLKLSHSKYIPFLPTPVSVLVAIFENVIEITTREGEDEDEFVFYHDRFELKFLANHLVLHEGELPPIRINSYTNFFISSTQRTYALELEGPYFYGIGLGPRVLFKKISANDAYLGYYHYLYL